MLDLKYEIHDGKVVNRVSGEAIPDDEPVMLFRARDMYATVALWAYFDEVCSKRCKMSHRSAVRLNIRRFEEFQGSHPERVKQPGVTEHIKLPQE